MWNKIAKPQRLGFLIVLIVSVLVYNRWFLTGAIFGWGDWGFIFSETAKEWFTIPRAWVGAGLGYVDIGLSMYLPVRVFYGILAYILNFNYFDKIVFLFPSVIISCTGAFLLAKKVTKNTIAAIVGSFVYSYNTYVLMLNTGHFTLSVAFGIGIYVFMLYQKTIETKRYFWAILTGLVAFLEFSYEARAFYLTAWILLLYFVYSLSEQTRFKLKEILKYTILSLIPLLTTILLSSFWLISLFINLTSFNGMVVGRQLYGEGHFLVQRAITTFHPFWTGSHRLIWGDPQRIFWWFWLIPFVAFAGYWFNRKNSQVVFWTIISLLGIFLTKFTSQPFTGVYLWLYQHLPGFNAFRESSKFNYFVDLGYMVLIASFVATVLKANINKWLKWLLTIGVSSLFLINTIPVFTGDLGRLLTPRIIPNDYLIFKRFIQNKPEFFRTLYFPRYSRWGYLDSTHPSLGIAELISSDWRELNNYKKTGLEYSAFEEMTNIFKKDFSLELLNSSSIRYIVVPIVDLENDEMFIFYSEPRQEFIDFLDKQPYLKKIDIDTSELVIYENYQYKPHLYLNDNSPLEVFRKSSDQYELTFDNKKIDRELFFSESFNSGWKVRVGNFSWWKSLLDQDYFLSENDHVKTNLGLNEFIVPQISDDTPITLYFAPQAWINVGSIVSLSTLSLLLVALIIFRKK